MIFAAAAPFFKVLQVSTELYLPMLLRKIVNLGIINKDLDLIIHYGLIMTAYALATSVCAIVSSIFSAKASHSFSTDIRSDLYRKMLSLSSNDIDEIEPGILMTNITNDVTQVQETVSVFMSQLINSPLKFIGSLILAISLSVRLSSVIFIMIPLVISIIIILVRKVYPIYEVVQKQLDKINMIAKESLSGIRIVKAFSRSKYENYRFNQVCMEYRNLMKKAARVNNIMGPSMSIVLNFGVLAVLWMGGKMYIINTLDIGSILAFINYLTTIRMSLTISSNMFRRVGRGEASSARIVKLLETEPSIQNPQEPYMPEKIEGKIEFDNVVFSYGDDMENPELSNITFTVYPGETLGILGSTGSGKTSIVNLIPRFYDINSGEIRIDDVNINEYDLDTLRNNISITMQNPVLFSGTIESNIKYGKPDAEQNKIIDAARIACIDDFIDSLDDKYKSIIQRRGSNLSGGQKQRIAIARSVISEAPILILDDSTSAVDIKTENTIQKYLKSSGIKRTIIVIAQKISTVIDADKIIVLENGQISDMGNHFELMEKSSIYKEIYDSQLGGFSNA